MAIAVKFISLKTVLLAKEMVDKKTLIRRLSFAAYFAAAFFIFLLFLFPYDRIKSRIESEVRLRTPL
ncbi:MAG TPA: hypothetical protein VI956_01105, partial [Nitrospirota bacterium]|nr:hypothetical protein [Nitrospirota bacterium]